MRDNGIPWWGLVICFAAYGLVDVLDERQHEDALRARIASLEVRVIAAEDKSASLSHRLHRVEGLAADHAPALRGEGP